MRKLRLKALCLLLAALMLSLTVLPAAAATSALASSIRLAGTTGTVTVTNGTSRALTIRDNMTLYNGYRVQTAARSYAWISLDSTKLTKLDASSRVEIRKSGSKLELLLSSGHIFFNVTSPLTSEETLNIRTSTMVVGIRGTSGWIDVIDRWTSEIYVLEGTVQCNATDPVTGQIKTATIESGEKAIAVAYPQDYEGDKCDIIQEKIEVSDLEGFVLTELAQDPELREEIQRSSGLDIREAVEAAQERLERDQQEMQNTLDRIDEALASQDSNVSTAAWEDEGDEPDDSTPGIESSGGSGGNAGDVGGTGDDGYLEDDGDTGDSGSDDPQSVVTLTVSQGAQGIQDALNQADVQEVVLSASDDPAQSTLYVDTAITVPEGKALTVTDGITVEVRDSTSLTVNGTMTGGALVNNGALVVNSPNTLEMSDIINTGTLTNNENGHIVAKNGIQSSGAINNRGDIDGSVIVEDGSFTMNGGEIRSDSGDGAVYIAAGGSATFTSGTVTNSGTGPALKLGVDDIHQITFAGTLFRAKAEPIITDGTGSFVPNGYGRTGPDEAGYLSLVYGAVNSADTFVADLNAGNSVTMTADIDLSDALAASITITNGTAQSPVILDLNGHTLTVPEDFAITVSGALLIRDGGTGGGGTLDLDYFITVSSMGRLILESGTVNGRDGNTNADAVYNGGTFTMEGGTINGGNGDYSSTVLNINDGIFTMDGGMINGGANSFCAVNNNGTFTLGGGTINGGNGGDSYAVYNGGTFIMKGGTINGRSNNHFAVFNSNSGDFTMENGTIDGGEACAVENDNDATFTMTGGEAISSSPNSTVGCSGGTLSLEGGKITNGGAGYALQISGSISSSYTGTTFRAKTDGRFILSAANGQIVTPANYGRTGLDGDGYYCLVYGATNIADTLVADLNAGNSVTMTADINLSDALATSITINNGNTGNPVILDLNGNTLTVPEDFAFTVSGALSIQDSSSPSQGTLDLGAKIEVSSSGSLLLKSGTINGDVSNSESFTINNGTLNGTVINNGTFTMEDGVITGTVSNNRTFTMENGTINGGSNSYAVNNNGGTFTMEGGTVIGEGTYAVENDAGTFNMKDGMVNGGTTNAAAVHNSNAATFNMTGGEVTSSSSDATIYNEGGTLSLEGGTITNSGTGYALNILGSSAQISYTGTTFRAMQNTLFITGASEPAGYDKAGQDSDGYYRLFYGTAVNSADNFGTVLTSAQNGQTVMLTADITLPGGSDISTTSIANGTAENPVILDLNGFTLAAPKNVGFTISGALLIRDSSGTDQGTLNLGEATPGDLPDATPGDATSGNLGGLPFPDDDLTLAVNIVVSSSGNLFLESGTINGGDNATAVFLDGGTFTMTGGTINAGTGSSSCAVNSTNGTFKKSIEATVNGSVEGDTESYSLPGGTKAVSAPAADSLFTDVPETAWYADAVRYAYEHGLMVGTGDGAFSPEIPASRGMIVTILYRLEEAPAASAAAFPDVPDGQWYADAVAWASENNLVKGYDNGKFGPDDPVTREQMAVFLYRYAAYKGYNTAAFGNTAAFLDEDAVSPYALDAVRWAVGNGLLQGADGNLLVPAANTARAQAATLLMRFREGAAHSYPMTEISSMDVMCEPSGILFLEDGSFLVTDTYNNVIWQVSNGVGTVYAGSDTVTDPFGRPIGGYNDAGLSSAYFKTPWAIAPFLGGYAVADADNNVLRLIRGKTVQTINGSAQESLGSANQGVSFNHPTGLASDGEGNLYVSDTFKGAVHRITPEGKVSTVIEGLTDPMGLCWKDGTLYIAETGANRIVKVTDGRLTVVAGSGEEDLLDGPADQAAFAFPQGVAVGDDGTIYVSDTVNGTVRQIKNGIVTTLARRDESDMYSVIPTSPIGLVVRGDQLYVCDSFARKVFVIALAR